MAAMASRKYKDDYEIVFTVDEKGREKREPVYRGDYFEASFDQTALLQLKRRSLLLLVVIFVLHLGSGFVNNQGMYQFYVSLPYVIGFFPLIYLGESILRIPKEMRKYRREEKEMSFDRVKTTSVSLIVFLVIGLIGEIVFLLFFSARGQGAAEFLYLALQALAISAGYFIFRLHQPVQIQTASETQQD